MSVGGGGGGKEIKANGKLAPVTVKKFFETVNCFQEEAQTAPKRPILFCSAYQGVFGHFTTILDYFKRFPKTNRGPTTAEDVRGTLQTLNSIFVGNSKHLKIGQFNSKH